MKSDDKRAVWRSSEKFGFAQMLRDVLVTSIDSGQFLFAITGLAVVIGILKMPSEDVSRLAFRLLDSIENGKAVGYVLAFGVAAGWFWHARRQQRRITHEMQRVGQLSTELQGQLIGQRLNSRGEDL